MATYGYCRVSGVQQEKGVTVQKDLIRECCTKQKLDEPIFFDDDATSTSEVPFDKRAGIQALLAVAQPGDHLVLWRIDRLERGFLSFYKALATVVEKGLLVHTIEEKNGGSLDLTTAAGRAMVAIYQIASDQYREAVQINTRRALQWRKSQGMIVGGGLTRWHKPVINAKGKWVRLEWDMDQFAIILEVATRFGKGEPVADIARDLWNRGIKDYRGKPWGFRARNPQSRSYIPFHLFYVWIMEFHRQGEAGKLPPPYNDPAVYGQIVRRRSTKGRKPGKKRASASTSS